MIDGLFNSGGYLAAKKMLEATALRHEAIASNLAGVETPGYKRIDVDPGFQSELQRAIGCGDHSTVAQLQPRLRLDPTAVDTTKDGNNVNLEHELVQLNQNSLAYTVETQLITSKLLQLRMAITGRSV